MELSGIVNGSCFGLAVPCSARQVKLSDFDHFATRYLDDFLKRNRGFLGKGARELLLQRMVEQDFRAPFSVDGPSSQLACLLVWGANL